jgi:rhomboid protease GluP
MIDDLEERELSENEWLPLPVEMIDPSEKTLSLQRARLWALVLEARYIESRMEPTGTGWQLLVPEPKLQDASHELRVFIAENRNWPPLPPPTRPMIANTLPTICILLLLATFHNITSLDISIPGRGHIDWFDIGHLQGNLVVSGEWWRAVTALTLHADALHLLGNLAIGGVFVVYLCRDLGSGLAWTLLVLSGTLGNLVNAYVQLPSHSSIGSSTAVFAAVGMLGAISVVTYRHHLRRRWPLPAAAALSLLALLGTEGKNTDLGAHLFGFGFGFLLGLVTEYLIGYFGRPRRLLNALLGIIAAGITIGAWWAAIMFAD